MLLKIQHYLELKTTYVPSEPHIPNPTPKSFPNPCLSTSNNIGCKITSRPYLVYIPLHNCAYYTSCCCKSTCYRCQHNEAVFFQSQSRKSEVMLGMCNYAQFPVSKGDLTTLYGVYTTLAMASDYVLCGVSDQ